MRHLVSVLALLCVASPLAARAEEPMSGAFTANRSCPAFQSIRNQTNPGNVAVASGQHYVLHAGNKPNPTYYRIDIDGAQPVQRWVAVDCGTVNEASDTSAPGAPAAPATPPAARNAGANAAYVFAVSWQAAFCEGLPGKAECQTQSPSRYDATHFTLHGLWPQPRGNAYCGVPQQDVQADKNHQWDQLREPDLSPATRQALQQAMPGTQSYLERHEWAEHGSCFFEKSADAYFAREVALIGQLNTSPVQKLFADNIGKQVQTSDIRAAFDQAFGPGAGDRVHVSCRRFGNRRVITEVDMNLQGLVGDNPSLSSLLANADPTDPGCPWGIVDPVGGSSRW
ncbi:ribonuclease T2 family protein [Methylovirgula sp. 4M-Z18]|uniref:ribonuclease T2 family protein n=1 Tax=Methylovirgula sp. 4M-Z18 TaxID=2293567 RepID=UPI000E2F20AA|nr:ribonuclease T [Methylovirgula sp. 4M-Z18]RFB79385.1 ribonuclease T [Methylovirgula sp. 4M-Z18]